MYIPAHFAETRPEELARIIRTHALGMLVTHGEAGLRVDHLPFEFDAGTVALGVGIEGAGANADTEVAVGAALAAGVGRNGRLTCHVARANPLWQLCTPGMPAMVVFRGADAYISPNWYPSKHAFHRQVPTWNYEAVHVHGTLTVMDDERFVRGVVARLTRRHEAGEPVPWKMGDSAPDYIDALLREVVGLEFSITSMQGKRKLSQNKDDKDREGAADALQARGNEEMAQAMRRAD